MRRGAAPLSITALLAAGLTGCASLPEWSGIAADSPASPGAPATPYTPPTNPFASALEPAAAPGDSGREHNGMTPGMKQHKGMMMPGMMKHDGKKPGAKNGGAPS